MEPKAASELVHLSQRRAVARHFDAANYRIVRWLLMATVPIALVAAPLLMSRGSHLAGIAWIPVLALGAAILALRASALFELHGRRFTLLYLALFAAAMALSFEDPEPGFAVAAFALPCLTLLLRLDRGEHLALAGFFLAVVAWSLSREGVSDTGTRIGMAASSLIVATIVVWIATTVTSRARSAFLAVWRREVSRERESRRMRSELENAREVQLSMLPIAPPAVDWLDFSSASLPASEVGGDYYDYFRLSGSRLAIVLADVAGHGMASGLVLSGVRSSLHLLREELDRPVEVLRRLDGMLRETVRGRSFVTFQIALLDPARGRLTVANAGHPPLFLASADGRVSRLGASSLPLGTRLPAEYEVETAPLAEGDTIVLVSDGVAEAHDLDGADFGERRLLEAVRRAHPGGGAQRVRDAVLSAVSGFKGDARQDDDLTLVVARIGSYSRGGPPA